MKIVQAELYGITIPLKKPFAISKYTFTHYFGYILRLTDEDGVSGVGESLQLESPWYSAESFEPAGIVLTRYLLPSILNQPCADHEELLHRMDWVQMNYQAKAAIETAVCDIMAKRANMPLYRYLGGENPLVEGGVSIGLSEDSALLEQIGAALSEGYKRIKVKIAPGHDEAVLDVVRGTYPKIALMADANAAYTVSDFDHLCGLDRYGMIMIEQPLGNGDFIDHAALRKRMKTPICLDESVHSMNDAIIAAETRACSIINIKPPRVGGPLHVKKMLGFLQQRQIGAWIGGMMESGIGRLMNMACATLENIRYAGDIHPPQDYLDFDLVDYPFKQKNGYLSLPQAPGFGAEVDWDTVKSIAISTTIL